MWKTTEQICRLILEKQFVSAQMSMPLERFVNILATNEAKNYKLHYNIIQLNVTFFGSATSQNVETEHTSCCVESLQLYSLQELICINFVMFPSLVLSHLPGPSSS